MAFAVGMNVFVSRSWDNMVVRIAEDWLLNDRIRTKGRLVRSLHENQVSMSETLHHLVTWCPPYVAWVLAAHVKFPCTLIITFSKYGKGMGGQYVKPF